VLYFLIGVLFSLVSLILLSAWLPTGETFVWVQSYVPSIQAMGSLAILASASVAVSLYRATTQRHIKEDAFKASEAFLSEAKTQLEKTYQLFSGGNDDNLPENSRVMWLTVARMIVRYRKLNELIKEKPHREIIEENEEFWRYKFYSLLDRNSDALSRDYFNSPEHRHGGNKKDRKSIAVIFDFAAWQGEDPLDDINSIELFADRIQLHNHFGLHAYLQENGFWDKVLEAQSNNNKEC
jgi:hypothetical protein